jgi:hypothetical protein
MNEPAQRDAVTLLVYALDEMRETVALLPTTGLARSTTRPWWRKVFFGFARSKAEVSAGFAVQYLGENIDRARGHWREVLSLIHELQHGHHDNAEVSLLIEDLQIAGLYDVLPQLQHDAIPHPLAKTIEHLSEVVDTIRYCDDIALKARSKLLLQRMRNE